MPRAFKPRRGDETDFSTGNVAANEAIVAVDSKKWFMNIGGVLEEVGGAGSLGTASTLDFDTDGTLAANSDAKIATQKATKTYLDTLAAGLKWKQPVRAATTAAGTLASDFENGDTVDGVTLATGDRILLKNQSSATENGIYIVAASGAPARSTDADSGAELVSAAVFVQEGTANADKAFVCTNNSITIGVTSIVFVTFLAAIGALLGSNNLSDLGSAPTALTNLGGTDVGKAVFTATNPSAIRFFRVNADNTVTLLTDSAFRTAIGAGTGNGTVTTFGAGNFTPLFTTSVANAGSTPNLSFTAVSKNPNLVFAGPASGGATSPDFRSLVLADIPTSSAVLYGAYDSLPAASQQGRIYFPRPSCYDTMVDTGAAWKRYVQGVECTDPEAQTWNWENQGTATENTTNGGIFLFDTANASAFNAVGKYKATPATPYTITCGIRMQAALTNYSQVFLGWQLASSKAMHVFVMRTDIAQAGMFGIWRYNSMTSFNASLALNQYIPVLPACIWLRFSDNGTNRKMEISWDRIYWKSFFDAVRSTFITPDRFIFGIDPYSHDTGLWLFDYAEA
jgi:hypothetical protein